jgi:hypothetical protein
VTTDTSKPELTKREVADLIRGLDSEICTITDICVTMDDDNDDGPTLSWSATVEMLDGTRYPATVPDHWPDGAEIHWYAQIGGAA